MEDTPQKKDEPRSGQQNRALHKWLKDNAEIMKKDGIVGSPPGLKTFVISESEEFSAI